MHLQWNYLLQYSAFYYTHQDLLKSMYEQNFQRRMPSHKK